MSKTKIRHVVVSTVFSWAVDEDDPTPTDQQVIEAVSEADKIGDYAWKILGSYLIEETIKEN